MNQTPLIPPQNQHLLFLYVSPNGGHQACADAVRKAAEKIQPGFISTTGIDAITTLYPFLGPLVAKAYLEILRYTPQIWNFLYDNSNIEEITRELRRFFNAFNESEFHYLLTKYHPTAFVCTHAIPCGVIAEQKKRGNCHLPLIGIITDYDVHSYWIYPEVDLYLVANQESKNTLIARGVDKKKIEICGIPVDPAFSQKVDPMEAKKNLGMDPSSPAILIMGGAKGLGPIERITKEMLCIKPQPQLMIAAGTNDELKQELAPYDDIDHVRLYGYTPLIPNLMDAADLVITKPGGITSSEALAKGLPMILVNPIPGQEERNARYLIKNGAAVQTNDVRALKETVEKFLNDPAGLSQISENSKNISTPSAALKSAQIISQLIKNRIKDRQKNINFAIM